MNIDFLYLSLEPCNNLSRISNLARGSVISLKEKKKHLDSLYFYKLYGHFTLSVVF